MQAFLRCHYKTVVLVVFAFLLYATPARADLVLETETARLGKQGEGTLGNGIQYEHAKDGDTVFSLTALEYAPTDRFEILFEPSFYERQFPKDGAAFGGIGDTELTLSYLTYGESTYIPAIVLAGKVKAPTGKSPQIGTGKFDYTGYIILGKAIGGVDFNANLAYETFGNSAGEHPRDQFIYALSADYQFAPRFTGFLEFFANTAPQSGERGTSSVAIAGEYQLTDHTNVFLSVGDDTDNTKIVKSGLNFTWGPEPGKVTH